MTKILLLKLLLGLFSPVDDIHETFTQTDIVLGLPDGLLESLCNVESGLDPNAVRLNDGGPGRHAIGICQVHARTAKYLGLTTNCKRATRNCVLFDPTVNILTAGLYLKKQLNRYKGNTRKAISAYNAGTATKVNRRYVDKVLGGTQ